ncbi:MAG: beta strand repeat-containing protein, partial [Prochlorotrichaceae cyanobacterium]
GNTGIGNRGIFLQNNSRIITDTGAIDLTGTGGIDGYGVSLNNAQIFSDAGVIDLTGTSNSNTLGVGVDHINNASISTNTGDIIVSGTGSLGAGGRNIGVVISAPITSTTGAINITGSALGTGTENHGIFFNSGAGQVASSSGVTTLTGLGGSDATSQGISAPIGTLGSVTGTGDLNLFADRMNLVDATVTGLGRLTIAPVTANTDFVLSLGTIEGNFSQINIGNVNTGTVFVNNATTFTALNIPVTITGSAINLNGTIDGSVNLFLNSPGLTTINGAIGAAIPLISLTTDAGGTTELTTNITTTDTIQLNDALTLTQPVALVAGNSITLGGTVTTQNFDLTTQSAALTLNTGVTAGTSSLTFITDSIDLQPGTNLSGTGVLSIIPLTESASVALGDNVSGTLNLTTAELSTIQDGFSRLIFGIATGTGDIYLGSNLNFLDPATIAGGNILFSPNDPLVWTPNPNIPGSGILYGLGADVTYENIFLVVGGSGLDRLVTATNTDDRLIPDGDNAITIGGVSYTGIDIVDALDGIDTLVSPAGNQIFSLSGATGAITLSGILFINIEVVEGGSGNNTLLGTTGTDTFNLASADAFTISGITFSGISTIDGSDGVDVIQGSVGDDTFTIAGANTGSGLGVNFLNIETVQGLDGNDQFILTSPDAFPTLDGGSGSDTFIADNQSNTFTLEGIDSGNIAGRGNWFGIENIIAGTGSDTFQLLNDAQITGAIVGGDGLDQLVGDDTNSGFVVAENNSGIIVDK